MAQSSKSYPTKQIGNTVYTLAEGESGSAGCNNCLANFDDTLCGKLQGPCFDSNEAFWRVMTFETQRVFKGITYVLVDKGEAMDSKTCHPCVASADDALCDRLSGPCFETYTARWEKKDVESGQHGDN